MASRQRILLAHYDPETLETLAEALGSAATEAEICRFRSGPEVIESFTGGAGEMVVVSGVLPGTHGFDVCRRVKQSSPRSVVVVLTDPDDGYGRGRARQAGADLILAEPVGPGEILEIIDAPSQRVDPLDLGKAGGRSHHERLLASIMGKAPGGRDAVLARFTDPVTGLFDHNYTRLRLEEEFKKSQRYGVPLALVMVDIDNYDEIVSRYGPMSADAAVLDVASVFLCESRDVDVAGRLDRARFVFILPNTDVEGGRVMADRIFNDILERKVDAPAELEGDSQVSYLLSVGIAACPNERVTSPDDLLELALKGLRTARSRGGNKICVWGEA